MLLPITSIIEFLDGKLGVSESKKINNTKLKTDVNFKKRSLAKQASKLPASFELIAPSIGFGVGIGYGESNGAIVDWELEGRIIADPIIGAKVRLDLLALGSKLKPWGVIIDALDIAAWLAESLSNGSLEINYELSFTLSSSIKLVGADSKDNTDTPTRITYNYATKELGGSVALKGVLEGKFVMSADFRSYIEVKKKKKIEGYMSEETKEKAFELGLGIEATCYVSLMLGKNFGKNDNWETDFYFSGVTAKVWVKFGYKGKSKTLEVIPSLEEKLNLFSNAGEIK
ncbi:hypothetical protein [Tenacibaculum sp. SDUM215027]|uniref:hypothetical protein n=1 Tax=Tenacibaculum sp. SDUM215027 TaxID=3422596 RepID=UPI003D312BA5